MDNLGYMYKIGRGVDIDFEKAAHYFKRALAADPDHPMANFHLAEMHLKGFGVERDAARALNLYFKSANQNFSDAAIMLAEMYEYGIGVEKDLAERDIWLEKAANMPEEYQEESLFFGKTPGFVIAKAKVEIH